MAEPTYEDRYGQTLLAKRQKEAEAKAAAAEVAASTPTTSENISADIEAGRQFGTTVLGEGGLGRMSATVRQGAEEMAKGMSGKEALAAQEKGMEAITSDVQARQRALQAALARTGVKGSAAGAAQAGVVQSGIEARGNLERDLILQDRDAKMQGLETLAGVEQFDLSQAAKESNVLLQSGLGFAGIGAAERGANLAAISSERAAAAQSGGGK